MKPLKPQRKSLMPIFVALLAAAVAGMIMLRSCSHPKVSVGDIALTKSLGDTIDIAIDYGPMSMYVKGDSISGFNYELLKKIEAAYSLPIKFHPFTSLDSALVCLDNGLFDVVVTDAPVTLDYESRYNFTEPVYLDRQVLVEHVGDSVSAGGSITSQLDLAGKKVWVVTGAPTEGRLHNLMSEIGDTIYIMSDPQYSSELLYMLTSIGEIQLCVINERVAKSMEENGGGAVISSGISFTQFQAWMTGDKNDAVKSRLDSALSKFKLTDAYSELCRKYGVRKVEKTTDAPVH